MRMTPIGQSIKEIVSSANLDVFTNEDLDTVLEDVDLVKSLSQAEQSFTALDKKSTFILLRGMEKGPNGYWTFPLYNVTKSQSVHVSAIKLSSTQRKGTGYNWLADSRLDEGIVTAFKFVDFKESRAGKQPVFPTFLYDVEKIAAHFDMTDTEVDAIISEVYADLEAPEKAKRRRIMTWTRKQPASEILLAEYLTKAGNANADALERRYGTLVYEVLERTAIR